MSEQVFKQLAERTNGDVYIGVVGLYASVNRRL